MRPVIHFYIIFITALIFFNQNSFAQTWIKTSDPPPGSTQFKLETGVENGNNVQFLLENSGQGLFKSTDNGSTFENIGLAGIGIRAFIDSRFSMQDGEYIVSASDGIYKTTDGGSNWQHYTTGIEGLYLTDIAELPIESPIGISLCVGTVGQGAFTSSDGGQTWEQMGTGLENKTVTKLEYVTLTSGPLPEVVLFATTQENGVYSFDFLNNMWLPTNNGNSNLFGTTAIAGDSQGNLFLASSPNVYSSPSDPINWQFEIVFDFVNTFIVTQDNQVFVSSLGDGVKLRISEGVWVDFSDGIPVDPDNYIDIGNLAIDVPSSSAQGQNLWAAYVPFDPNMTPGIYRTVNPITDVRQSEIETPKEFFLKQNYPNPFNPSTSIQYAISSRQFVSLKVYDVLGNEVTTLLSEGKKPGIYEVTFNASGLASGIYFYQLKLGNLIETKKMILLK